MSLMDPYVERFLLDFFCLVLLLIDVVCLLAFFGLDINLHKFSLGKNSRMGQIP